jgi:hypothetical protein
VSRLPAEELAEYPDPEPFQCRRLPSIDGVDLSSSMTITDAARYLGVDESGVELLIAEHKLSTFDCGRIDFISASDLKESGRTGQIVSGIKRRKKK